MLAEKHKYGKEKLNYYYLKQKLCGLALIILGVLCPFVVDGDATVSLLIVPLGLYLLFTKTKAMLFREGD